ncbi:DUF2846 domain-containing protein [Larkinella soli]|uniref:DUF2846 domain-containing protein n=1 Tax=Larkinella soli TaxID=1770527 RepID=UPI000FFB457D|nr:DUF2846 domain-containing protein [Larkinella soli]
MKLLLFMGLWWLGAVTGDEQPRNGQGRVVIYRQREFGGNSYDLKINDKKLGSLPTNRYLEIEVPPGRVKLESVKDYFSENRTLWLSVQAGHTYYVKAVEEVDFLSRSLLMAPIAEEQAQRELNRLKPARPSSH